MKATLFVLVPTVLFFVLALCCALFARRSFRTSLKIPFALFSFEAGDQRRRVSKPVAVFKALPSKQDGLNQTMEDAAER